jgi:hypothetical protein
MDNYIVVRKGSAGFQSQTQKSRSAFQRRDFLFRPIFRLYFSAGFAFTVGVSAGASGSPQM